MRRKYIGLLILIISLFNATLLTISATSEDMSDERYINQIEGTSSLDKDGNVVYHSNEELEETFSSEDIQLFSNEKISDYAVVNFRTKSSAGINTYYNEVKTGASGYLNGYYGADGAFLGYSSDGRVKFKSAGVVGLVAASDVELINYSNNLSVSCYWAENGRLYHYVAQNIKSQLGSQGINVNIVQLQDNDYYNSINSKNYDMVLCGINLSLSPSLETFFGVNNMANYSNDEVNNILNEVKNTTDENTLINRYKRLAEIYRDDVPYISLYNNKFTVAYSTGLIGDVTPNWFNIFYNISGWYK